MILVLTEADDVTADHVVERLERREASVRRLAPSSLPATLRLSLELDAGTMRVTDGKNAEPLGSCRVVFCRRPAAPNPPSMIRDSALRGLIARDCSQMLRALWEALPARWIPGTLPDIQRAETKVLPLILAQRVGLETPPTLVTNDARELLAFWRRHDGDLVTKPIGHGLASHFPMLARYTERVSPRDLVAAHALAACPVIVQKRVPKRLELRVTVVRDRVFAAAIDSQRSHHTRDDWRRYDKPATGYAAYDLPSPIAHACAELIAALGLEYGAIDLVLTNDGRFVFLEVNPAGEFLFVEQLTGMPIADALCDLLIEADEDGDTCSEPYPRVGRLAAQLHGRPSRAQRSV